MQKKRISFRSNAYVQIKPSLIQSMSAEAHSWWECELFCDLLLNWKSLFALVNTEQCLDDIWSKVQCRCRPVSGGRGPIRLRNAIKGRSVPFRLVPWPFRNNRDTANQISYNPISPGNCFISARILAKLWKETTSFQLQPQNQSLDHSRLEKA